MLMQVSAGKDTLLVWATKSAASLGDNDQNELEKLINEVLDKADDGSSPTATSSLTSTATVSPVPDSDRTRQHLRAVAVGHKT